MRCGAPWKASLLWGRSHGQKPLALLKHRCGIHRIIVLPGAEQLLIILDGQQRGGKKHGASALFQTFLKINCRIHAEQLQLKPFFPFLFGINHIIFIGPVIHIQKMPHLKIKLLQILFLRKAAVLLKKLIQGCSKLHQRKHQIPDAVQHLVILALALQLQHVFIAPLQCLGAFSAVCFHHFFQLQEIFFVQYCAVHLPGPVLRSRGYQGRVITITAKEKLCFCEEMDCNPEHCIYAKGHYDRVNDAVFDLLLKERDITREALLTQAEQFQVCPFELCLDVSLWTDVIICDYNYLFDPNVYLKRFFSEGIKGDYLFLVDEAHNLVDRAREMYSAVLYKEDFLQLKKVMMAVIVITRP